MKSKKLFLSTLIFVVAIVLTMITTLICGIALKPTVTESEFPFSITYELDGKTVTIDEVYKVHYQADEGYKYRVYVGEIGDMGEDNTVYTLKKDKNGRIELWTHFYPDYLMGDAEYDYFDDVDVFKPSIYYYDTEETEYYDEETLAKQGVKLISFEYPEPIKNSFTFSHIVFPESEVIFPTIVIAVLALVAILIFVKKDTDYVRKPIHIITIVFNFIIGTIGFAFVTIFAGLLSALGDVGNIMNLAFYLLPALTLLSIAASISLRRKLYAKSALIVQFVAPLIFVVLIAISSALSLV